MKIMAGALCVQRPNRLSCRFLEPRCVSLYTQIMPSQRRKVYFIAFASSALSPTSRADNKKPAQGGLFLIWRRGSLTFYRLLPFTHITILHLQALVHKAFTYFRLAAFYCDLSPTGL
jgi:hypothetical protein